MNLRQSIPDRPTLQDSDMPQTEQDISSPDEPGPSVPENDTNTPAYPPAPENAEAPGDPSANGDPSVNAEKSDRNWELARRSFFAASMPSFSAGGFTGNRIARSIGFFTLASTNASKAMKAIQDNDALAAAVNTAGAIGTGMWATGVAKDNSFMRATGPAVTAFAEFANFAATGKNYKERIENLVEGCAQTAWSVGTFTKNDKVQAAGFAIWAAGGLYAATQKPDALSATGKSVQGFGAALWAWGTASASSTLKGVGPAIIGAAELAGIADTLRRGRETGPILPTHHSPSVRAPSPQIAGAAQMTPAGPGIGSAMPSSDMPPRRSPSSVSRRSSPTL
ncbi:hypothetical protein [Streptomyces sp. NPDC058086]|uniref:hypothetical protein n=1 Tax=Streptomyces sp. NPDC058086 TaxID=3346334 RepID=UPI0036E43595